MGVENLLLNTRPTNGGSREGFDECNSVPPKYSNSKLLKISDLEKAMFIFVLFFGEVLLIWFFDLCCL